MAYSTKPKVWFWIAAILFLLWNLMGVGAWSAEAMGGSEAMMEGYTAQQVEFYTSFPSWYTWAYGVAVFTGLFSCIALLFKKKQAVLLALLSLVAVIVCRVHEVTMDAWNILGNVDKFFIVVVPVLSILLWLFARTVKQKGWLK